MMNSVSEVPTGQASAEAPAKRRRWSWPLLGLIVLGAVSIPFIRGTKSRANATTDMPALPTVAVAKVTREDLYKEVKLPGEFRPYVEVVLHAKVSGFVDKMNVDFGDRVKAGQLLATLDAPDLVAQYQNAIATEDKAEADYIDAHTNYVRMAQVNKAHPNLVAEQELDNAEAKDHATFAAISAAKADRDKFKTLVGYMKITAPFDGVVTMRYADPGDLIQAGTASDTQAKPLVRVSNNYRLRLDFYPSVDDVQYIHEGDQVDVVVDSLGGKTYKGTITRFTRRVEEDTRKMETELEVLNPNLELTPGMYARVVLKLDKRPNALAVPIRAISGTDTNATVYVVNNQHQIEERPVALGLETPDKYQVLAGLKEADLVVVAGRSRFMPGDKVEPKVTPLPTLP